MSYVLHMAENVNRAPIDKWIRNAYPNGLYKLSVASHIPVNSLTKIRLGVWIPKDPFARRGLANVLKVSEDELFPSTKRKAQTS